ncbi:MAG TPA: hypothetical protein PK725_17735 [Rhodocyclaceae bacterium]|nr:hypothetical protein [Rhodocyclaceae bacterium]
MNFIDATPPADFPAQVVIMDPELGLLHPNKTFYLRVGSADGADHAELDGAVTPVEARRMAREKGFDPTHWMMVGDARPTMF